MGRHVELFVAASCVVCCWHSVCFRLVWWLQRWGNPLEVGGERELSGEPMACQMEKEREGGRDRGQR